MTQEKTQDNVTEALEWAYSLLDAYGRLMCGDPQNTPTVDEHLLVMEKVKEAVNQHADLVALVGDGVTYMSKLLAQLDQYLAEEDAEQHDPNCEVCAETPNLRDWVSRARALLGNPPRRTPGPEARGGEREAGS